MAGEQAHVMSIRLVGGIAEVVARLQISREAPDPAAADAPHRREPIRRIGAEDIVAQRLPPVPVSIEDHRVEVDLAPRAGVEDESRRQSGSGGGVVRVVQGGERIRRAPEPLGAHHDVEVAMGPGLLADEGIDAPSAVHPEVEPDRGEPI